MARDALVGWEPEARDLLCRLRTLAAHRSGDPRYTQLLEEPHEDSPHVRDWWPRYEVQARHSDRKRHQHPGGERSPMRTPPSTWPNNRSGRWSSTSRAVNRPAGAQRGCQVPPFFDAGDHARGFRRPVRSRLGPCGTGRSQRRLRSGLSQGRARGNAGPALR
ncbi:hypothetical protein [Streptomyces qinglanensis]|uniref:MmyB family transcriptional regulator n=1 Tax=Streptomyces qinglanensis TaxID=943816 RepID=UPI003D2EB47B